MVLSGHTLLRSTTNTGVDTREKHHFDLLDEVDWSAYARQYDFMCDLNPAYRNNVDDFAALIETWELPATATVCDIGAGTGNFILEVSRHLPNATFVHIDNDSSMNEAARSKYREAGIESCVTIIEKDVRHVNLPDKSFDLILSTNALYAISPQEKILKQIRSWVTDCGYVFLIDFGRKQNVVDWGWYFLRETVRDRGVLGYIKACFSSWEIIAQNRRTLKGQDTGKYWLHTTSEFGKTLQNCGFAIEELRTCYRGYADLAVCKRNVEEYASEQN